MNDITIDYEPYLRVTEGNIWWVLMDAIRLGAGWLPVRDERRSQLIELRAPDNYARDNVRTLLGAFRDDRLGIERPMNFERDGFRFVEAEGFLDWLAQYITREQATEITFPSELGHEVRLAQKKAAESRSKEQEFESLELALEGWFDKNLDELPDELRQRVEQWLPGSTLWDDLSVEQRRDGAHKRDYWYDLATEQEREDHWAVIERKLELQREIKKWEAIPAPDAINLEKKETHLKKLRLEKERLEQLDPCKRKGQSSEVQVRSDKKGGRPPKALREACEKVFLYLREKGDVTVIKKNNLRMFLQKLNELGDDTQNFTGNAPSDDIKLRNLKSYVAERIESVKIHRNGECSVKTKARPKGEDITPGKTFRKQDVSRLLTDLRKKYPLPT